MKENQITPERKTKVYNPKFDLSPAGAPLVIQLLDFLMPVQGGRCGKIAHQALKNVSEGSAALQAEFIKEYRLEHVTSLLDQTDEPSVVRAMVAASLIATIPALGYAKTASERIEEAMEMLSELTMADW